MNQIVIPRPPPPQYNFPPPSGLGKVIIEYDSVNSAAQAREAMNGRKFAGRTVVAAFLSEDNYKAGLFDGV